MNGYNQEWLDNQSAVTLGRLMPRLEARFGDCLATPDWENYTWRVNKYFPRLLSALYSLYGHH